MSGQIEWCDGQEKSGGMFVQSLFSLYARSCCSRRVSHSSVQAGIKMLPNLQLFCKSEDAETLIN